MSTYTKGPWHVEYELDENREKTDVIFIAHPETDCDMTAIAHLYNILAPHEENKANAYLIAAAPEMKDILEELLMSSVRALHLPNDCAVSNDVIKKATALIAKFNVPTEKKS